MNPDNLGEEFDTGNELTQVKSKLQEFSDDQDIIGDNREQLQSKVSLILRNITKKYNFILQI